MHIFPTWLCLTFISTQQQLEKYFTIRGLRKYKKLVPHSPRQRGTRVVNLIASQFLNYETIFSVGVISQILFCEERNRLKIRFSRGLKLGIRIRFKVELKIKSKIKSKNRFKVMRLSLSIHNFSHLLKTKLHPYPI